MESELTFCKTRAGKGFKIVVDGQWFYTSLGELYKVITGKTQACRFRSIEKQNGK